MLEDAVEVPRLGEVVQLLDSPILDDLFYLRSSSKGRLAFDLLPLGLPTLRLKALGLPTLRLLTLGLPTLRLLTLAALGPGPLPALGLGPLPALGQLALFQLALFQLGLRILQKHALPVKLVENQRGTAPQEYRKQSAETEVLSGDFCRALDNPTLKPRIRDTPIIRGANVWTMLPRLLARHALDQSRSFERAENDVAHRFDACLLRKVALTPQLSQQLVNQTDIELVAQIIPSTLFGLIRRFAFRSCLLRLDLRKQRGVSTFK